MRDEMRRDTFSRTDQPARQPSENKGCAQGSLPWAAGRRDVNRSFTFRPMTHDTPLAVIRMEMKLQNQGPGRGNRKTHSRGFSGGDMQRSQTRCQVPLVAGKMTVSPSENAAIVPPTSGLEAARKAWILGHFRGFKSSPK
ncbi:hypothetical protein Bbelb_436500 [Branchiostoma belcheri]|nr:hypothetical protein Bbelb_436500 [Branchiostoma belcheri]